MQVDPVTFQNYYIHLVETTEKQAILRNCSCLEPAHCVISANYNKKKLEFKKKRLQMEYQRQVQDTYERRETDTQSRQLNIRHPVSQYSQNDDGNPKTQQFETHKIINKQYWNQKSLQKPKYFVENKRTIRHKANPHQIPQRKRRELYQQGKYSS